MSAVAVDDRGGESPSREFISHWVKTSPKRSYPALDRTLRCEVAVIGGGIAGLSAALELKRRGAEVMLIEARHIGAGTTGYTTAKLTSLHGLAYSDLIKTHDEQVARAYGEANEWGVRRIAENVERLGIDCDFRPKPNYTYTLESDGVGQIEDEVAAATRVGLPASLVMELPELPFGIAAAVRFDDQAEFHPLKYLAAVAEEFDGDRCRLFERSRVTQVRSGGAGWRLQAGGGKVEAEHVIVASHLPVLDRGLYFARTHPERSYVLLAELEGDVPQGMYLSDESPAHSLRSVPRADRGEYLMVGGESHKAGQSDAAERHGSLEDWARGQFLVRSIPARWASQDNMPADGLPFIGKLAPFWDRLWTATGFKKWGLAIGTASGRILADLIEGTDNDWAPAFSPSRIDAKGGLKSLLQENANVARRFALDRVAKRPDRERLGAGEGAVVGEGLAQRAVYRDESGRLHELSARCTHLGCIVNFNRAERTWDCPCHGSRFALDGGVIEGPAVAPLGRHPGDDHSPI